MIYIVGETKNSAGHYLDEFKTLFEKFKKVNGKIVKGCTRISWLTCDEFIKLNRSAQS